ncbi:MAG: amidohydrolase [Gammaproteobacteria bacterium]|nr:amidohydrolase [Gammaproteobacteria bacterium]
MLRLLLLFLLIIPVRVSAQLPVADMHLHYKWSQQEVTSPEEALRLLGAAQVAVGVVIGTPAERALALTQRSGGRLVSIWSPYREGGDWSRWATDKSVVQRARAALASGNYSGIGELHLVGGFAPRSTPGDVTSQLMTLAAEYDVPVLLHTEFSRADRMRALCTKHPRTRIVWAHAGAILPAAAVESVLASCDNVVAGLAARDPWRFVNNPITDTQGKLLPAWRALLLRYPDRFMVGSDPVWPVDQLDRWDEADTGWQELERFWIFHRGWLADLPANVAVRIACKNAADTFMPTAGDVCVPPLIDE